MKIRAICFTEHGKRIINRLLNDMEGITAYIKIENVEAKDGFKKVECPLSEWAADAFDSKDALVFVGAMGIAIRAIAGLVKDKLTDSPVIVIDDKGQFIIPVLSGHVGGANELAMQLSEILDGIAVITTSTDSGDAFAVDLFAKENNLKIVDRDNIKRVSAKSIEGKCITLSIKDYPPTEPVDVIVSDEMIYPSTITLAPKKYVAGIGLKRGKSAEAIEKALFDTLDIAGIGINEIGAFATIDIKLDEVGLKKVAEKYRIPLIGFESSILQKARGEFSTSQFVKDTVGVDNVCERAAVIATDQGQLIVRKQAMDGVTVAIAKKR